MVALVRPGRYPAPSPTRRMIPGQSSATLATRPLWPRSRKTSVRRWPSRMEAPNSRSFFWKTLFSTSRRSQSFVAGSLIGRRPANGGRARQFPPKLFEQPRGCSPRPVALLGIFRRYFKNSAMSLRGQPETRAMPSFTPDSGGPGQEPVRSRLVRCLRSWRATTRIVNVKIEGRHPWYADLTAYGCFASVIRTNGRNGPRRPSQRGAAQRRSPRPGELAPSLERPQPRSISRHGGLPLLQLDRASAGGYFVIRRAVVSGLGGPPAVPGPPSLFLMVPLETRRLAVAFRRPGCGWADGGYEEPAIMLITKRGGASRRRPIQRLPLSAGRKRIDVEVVWSCRLSYQQV